jgi:hypothetical protein
MMKMAILYLALTIRCILTAAQVSESINYQSVGSSSTHYPGELYQGGVVFWVDNTGSHGRICSMTDLSTSSVWCNWIGVTGTLIGASAQNDWDGLGNSNAIVGQSGHTTSAAELCLDYINENYGTGTYSDWYLPGHSELNELFNNIKAVQKALESDGNDATTTISETYYWSSSEYSGYFAWLFSFRIDNPIASFYDNKQDTFYVRAVRAF